MGRYYLPVNKTKMQFLDPHTLGNGLKLYEQMAGHPGIGAALIILLSKYFPNAELPPRIEARCGSWAGDDIYFACDSEGDPVFDQCQEGIYEDISLDVAAIIESELRGHYIGTPTSWREFVRDVKPEQLYTQRSETD